MNVGQGPRQKRQITKQEAGRRRLLGTTDDQCIPSCSHMQRAAFIKLSVAVIELSSTCAVQMQPESTEDATAASARARFEERRRQWVLNSIADGGPSCRSSDFCMRIAV